MRAKIMRGLPVIEMEKGSVVGRVQDLYYQPCYQKSGRFNGKRKSYLKGRSHLIPFAEIRSIGQDTVIVKTRKCWISRNIQIWISLGTIPY